jgi:F-type H+-transporting ATPase subunit epsilon
MRLTVLLPHCVLVETEAVSIIAEGEDGFFSLLPRHIDFASALRPGVLYFTHPDGREAYAALDEAILVKQGLDVAVSALAGVSGTDLARLGELVQRDFVARDEHERQARTAMARLEAGALRRFIDLEERQRA